jgi:hypothetical protein
VALNFGSVLVDDPGVKLSILRALSLAVILAVSVTAGDALARTSLFAKPKTYRVVAQRSCGSTTLYSQAAAPHQIPAPGEPGLTATATSRTSAIVHWTVAAPAPSRCPTATLIISLGNYARWMPSSVTVRTNGHSRGSVAVRVWSGEPVSDTVIASAFGTNGGRSALSGVLVRR